MIHELYPDPPLENEAAVITLSTKLGPVEVHAYQIGSLAAHAMLSDDPPLVECPENGFGVSLAAKGLRLAYGGRVFKGFAFAVAFVRACSVERNDWERWFDGPIAPMELQVVFKRLQDEAEARGELHPVAIATTMPI